MAGIVLAGGRSSRLGTDKTQLPFRGSTLLGTVVARLSEVTSPVIVVAATNGAYIEAGARTIGDLNPGAGPVGGIITGLAFAGPGRHLCVACDLPLVKSALLRLLLEKGSEDVDAVVPFLGAGDAEEPRPEPTCALYSHSALESLRAFLASGGRAAHRALDLLRVGRVEEAEVRRVDPELISFTNINTSADYEWLLTVEQS